MDDADRRAKPRPLRDGEGLMTSSMLGRCVTVDTALWEMTSCVALNGARYCAVPRVAHTASLNARGGH